MRATQVPGDNQDPALSAGLTHGTVIGRHQGSTDQKNKAYDYCKFATIVREQASNKVLNQTGILLLRSQGP